MTLLFIIIMPLVGLIGVNHTEIAAIITSIGLLFAVVVSILCLFVLKFYRIINRREKLSYSSTTTSGAPGNYRGSSYVSNNESANKSRSSYVEHSKKEEKGHTEKSQKSQKSESSSSSEEPSDQKGKDLPLVVNKSTDLLLPPANNNLGDSQVLSDSPSSPDDKEASDSEQN